MPLSAVILAAGLASRFGGCKALAPIDGISALNRCLNAFTEGGTGTIVVVTGAWRDEITAALRERKVFLVHNPRFEEGMFTSVQTGLSALEDDCRGVFVHPADIPLVLPATVRKLGEAFRPGRWAVPAFEGTEGHPVLLPGSYREPIRNWSGEGGLRGFLAARKEEKIIISVSDEGILRDMDVPEDLKKLEALVSLRAL